MSGPDQSNGQPPSPEEQSVLSNLPRTRPQRSSARRAAARDSALTAAAAVGEQAPRTARPAQRGRQRAAGSTAAAKRPSRAKAGRSSSAKQRTAGS